MEIWNLQTEAFLYSTRLKSLTMLATGDVEYYWPDMSIKCINTWAGAMAQWVKTPAAKPGNLSLISRTHRWKEPTPKRYCLTNKQMFERGKGGLTIEQPQFLADINTTSY